MSPAFALGLGLLAATIDPLTARITAADAAAQALQGVLDGAWTLTDPRGRVIYALQITDPPNALGPLEGAWRDGAGRIGAAEVKRLVDGHIELSIAGGPTARLGVLRGAVSGAAR